MSYGRYRAIFFCKAEYDLVGDNIVASTSLMRDFPMVLGADVFFDSIEVYRPWSRDPADGAPLWVDQVVSRYKKTVVTHGVASLASTYAPEQGQVPAVALVEGWVTNAAVLGAIDAVPKFFIVGVFPEDVLGDPIPAPLEPYATNVPMPAARWTELRNGMVTLGMDGDLLDRWKDNHPDATPLDIAQAFRSFIA